MQRRYRYHQRMSEKRQTRGLPDSVGVGRMDIRISGSELATGESVLKSRTLVQHFKKAISNNYKRSSLPPEFAVRLFSLSFLPCSPFSWTEK